MIGYVYWGAEGNTTPHNVDTAIKVSMSCGTGRFIGKKDFTHVF